MATIDMQTMRYMNLLDRVAHVKATKCFTYNNTIYFAVSPRAFSQALGIGNRNVKIISEQLGKRIRVIKDTNESEAGVLKFLEAVISPVSFVSLEIKEGMFVLTAGSRERAATLIGRNKVRLEELSTVMQAYFGKALRIV